jgi:hypothetical protein
MSNTVITIRKETTQAFLPAEMNWSGEIDLGVLAAIAKEAINKSDMSLAAASAIADGSWWDRFFKSGDMQRHVIQSITHIRDISKVNLGLSAICNDLAAANLEHANRIDINHHATNQQLGKVEKLTTELLEHLRRPREPGLLDSLLPALSTANPSDQNEMHGWLRSLTQGIDLQYSALQKNLDVLSTKKDFSEGTLNQLGLKIASLGDLIEERIAYTNRQHFQLRTETFDKLEQSDLRANDADTTLRLNKEQLQGNISSLTREMTKRHAEVLTAIQAERVGREDMHQSLVKLIKEREKSVRATIGKLNQHLLKRMLWTAGGIVTLQIAGFAYFAFKLGLWV